MLFLNPRTQFSSNYSLLLLFLAFILISVLAEAFAIAPRSANHRGNALVSLPLSGAALAVENLANVPHVRYERAINDDVADLARKSVEVILSHDWQRIDVIRGIVAIGRMLAVLGYVRAFLSALDPNHFGPGINGAINVVYGSLRFSFKGFQMLGNHLLTSDNIPGAELRDYVVAAMIRLKEFAAKGMIGIGRATVQFAGISIVVWITINAFPDGVVTYPVNNIVA
ncbi:MAG: hypothetical protein Q9174_003341 [Haloplaca sp. 1 TL-2023]